MPRGAARTEFRGLVLVPYTEAPSTHGCTCVSDKPTTRATRRILVQCFNQYMIDQSAEDREIDIVVRWC